MDEVTVGYWKSHTCSPIVMPAFRLHIICISARCA